MFRHSALLRAIDASDPAILNSTVRPFLFKTLTPINTASNNFNVTYPGSFYVPNGVDEAVITSTAVTIGGVETFFSDKAITGSTNRQIFAFRLQDTTKVTTIDNCGTVNPTEGSIILNNFIPDNTNTFRITVIPLSNDIAPKRDEILSIDATRTTMTAEEDSIAVSGSSGSVTYGTTSRFRS